MSRALGGFRRLEQDRWAAAALIVLALILVLPTWGQGSVWATDSLFYEAQRREVLGQERYEALHDVFASGLAVRARGLEADLPPRLRRVEDPRWVRYSSRFYRRRWTVPAAAAVLDPITGTESLKTVSLLGYVVLGPLLYLLLRHRFEPLPSAAATSVCLVLPPLLAFAPRPLTDTWGLSLLVAGLCLALRVRRSGMPWLPAWIGTVVLLSWTRDATIVLVAATAWLALRERSRRTLAVALTGLLASLPAPLLSGASLRENLAYVFNDFRIPPDTSWGFVLREYPATLFHVLRSDLAYPLQTGFPPLTAHLGLAVLVGLGALLLLSPREDGFLRLHRGALVGALLTVLVSVNYTRLRLELVFVPCVAVGLALLVELTLARWRAQQSRRAETRDLEAGPSPPAAASPAPTPEASTAIRTRSSPGTGSGDSSWPRFSAKPKSCCRIACIVRSVASRTGASLQAPGRPLVAHAEDLHRVAQLGERADRHRQPARVG
jgi:hypothetical protein